jgi:fructose-bisphosphate aldolase class I
MNTADLEATALSLVTPGKGILAADESRRTLELRFNAAGMPFSDAAGREYREILFSTPGLGAFISGVILTEETLAQATEALAPLVAQHLCLGVKVDRGPLPLALFPGETCTEGLDGLRSRLHQAQASGARFSKWRAVFGIQPHGPTDGAVQANAHVLARFAALSQEVGLVPVVEPEVLMTGSHSLERHAAVTTCVLREVFRALAAQRVHLEAMVLKTNLVLPGSASGEHVSPAVIAGATLQVMRRVVPAAVPGIAFLSGGQSEEESTRHLNALNHEGGAPWQLSFSFGRALQHSALRVWAGVPANRGAAQAALHRRAACNSAARFGNYDEAMERAA